MTNLKWYALAAAFYCLAVYSTDTTIGAIIATLFGTVALIVGMLLSEGVVGRMIDRWLNEENKNAPTDNANDCVTEQIEIDNTVTCDDCGSAYEASPDDTACPLCGYDDLADQENE